MTVEMSSPTTFNIKETLCEKYAEETWKMGSPHGRIDDGRERRRRCIHKGFKISDIPLGSYATVFESEIFALYESCTRNGKNGQDG